MFGKIKNINLKEKFLIIFITMFVVSIFAVGYLGYTKTNELNYKYALVKDKRIVSTITNDLNTFIKSVPQDLEYLASSYAFKRYLLWRTVGVKESSQERKNESIDAFMSFVRSKKYIYKIRFLDLKGDEQINIKYNNKNNTVKVITKKDLQNKKDKNYFKIPLKYKTNVIYTSDLDLNKEYGEFSFPYIPVVRFSKPIIDNSMRNYGVFAITVHADYFLDRIRKYEKQLKKEKREIFLIDNNGYYLFNKDKSKLWGKNLSHKETLKRENIELFNKMQKSNDGIYDDGNNLYTYEKIYPSNIDKSNYWVLYTITNKSYAFKDLSDFKTLFIAMILLILVVVSLLIIKFISQITEPISRISKHFDILSLGKVPKDKIIYESNDEIGGMINSMSLLSNNSSDTIKQVKLIASGDLTKNIKLLSSEDELSIAINNMTQTLKTNDESTKLNNWFSEGMSDLTKLLSAEMSFEDLANKSTAFICRYLDMGKGVFYVLDKEQNILTLTGSYMHTSRDTFGDKYAVGEGSIGQVAQEKKPILLTRAETTVSIALNDLSAFNSYTFPLIYENEVYGAIELVSLNQIDQKSQDFLSKAQDIICSILYSVKQREKIEKLFEKTKESQVDLQNQKEELQQANSQMVEQQQILEETNAEMSEQRIELEGANAQMEEQQQSLEEYNQNLMTSKKELDEKASALEISSKYKSEFLANMSHELRTPLNAIILLSDALAGNKKENLGQEDIKKANIIHSSGNELLRLIEDVLDLSKVEAGKMNLQVDTFDSIIFCEEIKLQFEHQSKKKNLLFNIVDNYDGKISNDKNKLAQIVRNLISNSLKFTSKGSISLQIQSADEGQVKISVIDTGIGIPQDKLQIIFEAFQQEDGSISRKYGGTGLGLSISKEMSKLMGGEILVESKEGEGSTFSIVIPNLNTSLEIPKEIVNSRSNVKDDREKLSPTDKAFLIIEDDETFAQILAEQVKEKDEYVLVATTGSEGLALSKQYSLKGLLLDLGLPDIDGIDILKEFKTDVNLRRVPVYVISGKDKEINSKDKGAIGYTQKPVEINDITNILKEFDTFHNKPMKDLLIVEDNDIQREALIDYIGNGTIKSTGVSSVKQAISELDKDIYDAVIVDLSLEEGSGYDICEYIKSNKLNIPIIIYTGKNLTQEEEKKLRAYTDSIIIKTASSQKRLLNDVDMFLHRVRVSVGNKTYNAQDINLKGNKILVVDDDIRNIYVLSEMLGDKGAQVVTALNGQEALDTLDDMDDIDMVLMDIMMPIMDGHEATRKIRANDKTKNLPVIALTAKAMPEDKQNALDAGCNDFVTKPLKVDILMGIIQSWLKKS